MSPEEKTRAPSRRKVRTVEEIEQRRLKRVLRNRKAAQTSREKKRKHVVFLEDTISRLERYIEVLSANYQRLYLACDPNTLQISGARPLDAFDGIKNQLYTNNELGGSNNIMAEVQRENYKNIVDNSSYLGSSQKQNITSPISQPNNYAITAAPTNTYSTPNTQNTGESLYGSMQNYSAFESNEDSLYYSYLSRISLNIPWEKQNKRSDSNYPPMSPDDYQSNL